MMLDVNEMLKDDITKITNSLIPPGFKGDVRSIRLMQDSLSKVIDQLGELSAEEQGLSKVITTAEKLRTADSHTLYLIKDANAKDGKGEALGLLKVGRKHLFLFDEKEAVREVEPLCVLDFFVKRENQRRGLGKALFQHMLQDMNTTADRLAIDGPSEKFEAFLAKNYGMVGLVRQNNNFAVAPSFFDSLPADTSKSAASTPSVGRNAAVGRYTAQKPQSSVGKVIHGGVPFHPNSEGTPSETAPAKLATPAPAAAQTPSLAQPSPVRPRTLPVSAAALQPAPAPPPAPVDITPAGVPSRRDSQLTDKGFFDVKFHHKKLW